MSDERNDNWERDILTRVALAGIQEQRRARRWGIFFKSVGLAYAIFLLIIVMRPGMDHKAAVGSKHTALVDLSGVIAPGTPAEADTIVTGLRAAFEDENTAGVILRINSPGGSPVQSGYIYDEIMRLREKYPETPIYSVISDICASGGYYVAAATDKIFANKSSIVGSIGVRMDNFGFVEAMEKLGIERRQLTAGENKALLDPFSPMNENVNHHLQGMLDNIHQQFITAVRTGRGDRLKEVEGIFSGLIWTGDQSVEIGLVDGLGSTGFVAREVIGEENIIDFTPQPHFLKRISDRLGASLANIVEQQFVLQLR